MNVADIREQIEEFMAIQKVDLVININAIAELPKKHIELYLKIIKTFWLT